MLVQDIRSELAHRLSKTGARLPTSTAGRIVRSTAGFAEAGARSLSRSILRRIGRGQPDLGPERALVATVGQLKGVPMKMGQILGYIDLGLPPNLRAALSALHTHAQPLGVDRIRSILEADFGPAGRELGRLLHPEPLSAVSVGQVHRATLPDGSAVVVKVVHPRLSEIIARDFAPARITSRLASFLYPRAHLDTIVDGLRARFLDECDYALEARRQQRFAELFAVHPTVVVPAVVPAYCSARVLTTSFVGGVHLDDYLASQPSQAARNRAGEALFDVYIGTLFKHGLYNCDPHPGNYLFLPDGRVAIFDYGCAHEFQPGFTGRLSSLLAALGADDGDLIHRALVELGIVGEGRRYDADAGRWLLRAFFEPLLRDEVTAFDPIAGIKLGGVLRRWWRARAFTVSGELPFLLRTFVGLSSVLGRLGARGNWYRRLQERDESGTGTHVAATPARPRSVEAVVADAAVASSAPEAEETAAAPTVATQTVTRRATHDVANESEGPAAWDLVLIHPGASQIAVLRELRELTGMDLTQLKYLIDASPRTIRQAMTRAVAESLRLRLETAGARVEVRPTALRPPVSS